jgi:hypothetical protein
MPTTPPDAAHAHLLRDPAAARWIAQRGSHLAALRYADAWAEADPRATVLAFYECAYRAGAGQGEWDIAGLACPGGVTDPMLRSRAHG